MKTFWSRFGGGGLCVAVILSGVGSLLAAGTDPLAVWHAYLDAPTAYAAFTRSVTKQAAYDCGNFIVERYEQANGPETSQRVLMAVPKGKVGRRPAVVVPFYFPEALLGFDPATGKNTSPYAPARTNLTYYAAISYLTDLAQRGYVAVSADAYHITYPKGVEKGSWAAWKAAGTQLTAAWPSWTGLGKLVFDTRLLIDLVAADDRVDAARIGILGHSLGGKMAYYTGCLDARVKVIVASDFGLGWDQTNWQDVWYWGTKLPDIRTYGGEQIALLSATGGKPFCLQAGKYDTAFSGELMKRAKGYEGHPERLLFLNHATGHRPPRTVTETGYRFLDTYLK